MIFKKWRLKGHPLINLPIALAVPTLRLREGSFPWMRGRRNLKEPIKSEEEMVANPPNIPSSDASVLDQYSVLTPYQWSLGSLDSQNSGWGASEVCAARFVVFESSSNSFHHNCTVVNRDPSLSLPLESLATQKYDHKRITAYQFKQIVKEEFIKILVSGFPSPHFNTPFLAPNLSLLLAAQFFWLYFLYWPFYLLELCTKKGETGPL